MTARERNYTIDYIKLMMAIIIMVYHYSTRYAEMIGVSPYNFQLKNGGTVGVAVFFIISSMFAMRSLNSNEKELFSYLKGKWFRLYPQYLVSVLIIYLVSLCYPLEQLRVSFASFLVNLLGIQRFIGVESVDGAHWYIAFLMVMHFWLAFFKKTKVLHSTWIYLLWLVLITIFCSDFLSAIGFTEICVGSSKIQALINVISMERYAVYVIVGVFLYRLAEKQGNIFCNFFVIILCLLRNTVVVGISNILIISLIAIVVYFSYIGKLRLNYNKFFCSLAGASYGVYLIHQNIGYSVLYYLRERGFTSEWWIILPMIISFLLALLTTKLTNVIVKKILS